MPLRQIEIFVIVGVMLALFVWQRIRYDVVASLALIAAVTAGCLPADRAFSGFANPVVVVIASILVVSRGIQQSGVVEIALRRALRGIHSIDLQVGALTAGVSVLSAVMKNVGALALMLPVALQTAARADEPPSIYLMPLAFASLIGGAATLIGTSPNLLISAVRVEVEGKPFSMFDFAPVGGPLAMAAVVFLAFGWRLLPRDRRGRRMGDTLFDLEKYTTELRVRDASQLVGRSVGDLEKFGDGEIDVAAIVRAGGRRFVPSPEDRLESGDLLTVRADAAAAKKIADAQGLDFAAAESLAPTDLTSENLEAYEAVVMPDSPLVGRTPRTMRLRRRYEASLLAVSRSGRAISSRLHDHVFAPGDVVVIQGGERDLPDTLVRLGCLPLADRGLNLARRGGRWIPVAILGAALAVAFTGLASVEIAFFAAAVAMVLFRQVTPNEAYSAIEWPVIVMLAALIPLGEAMRDTGGSAAIAQAIGHLAAAAPPFVALGLVLAAAMLLAPAMHHAAAVLVLGPISAAIAQGAGLRPDGFLMAVALGASCDFLTPIGHQNNLLVMAPGGYRFGDYWRLGLPLSLLVLFGGTALIAWVWPLR